MTAVELMPVAQFSGNRGWGYDGVLLYAPHVAYGGPDALKRLVDAAHARGLMVLLDVVYNHFGPDGNYLNSYAPDFFHPERHTPWGAAIAYDRAPVRDYFVDNACYWIEEYRFDGLRLDAIDQIHDESEAVASSKTSPSQSASACTDRHVHLTTEDDRNVTDLHQRAGRRCRSFTRRVERRFPSCRPCHRHRRGGRLLRRLHRGSRGQARPRAGRRLHLSGRAVGFRDGARRGEPSAGLPPTAFIDFLQNHDQAGNRAFGERLACLAPARRRSTR